MAELQYTGDGPSLSAEKRMRRAINQKRIAGQISVDDAKAISDFALRRPDAAPDAVVTSLLGGFEPTSGQARRLAGDDYYRKAAAAAIADAYMQKMNPTLGSAAPGNAAGVPVSNAEEWVPAGNPGEVEQPDPNDDWTDTVGVSALKGVSRFAMTAGTSLYDLIGGAAEAISGQLGGSDNNDVDNPGDIAANWFNQISMVQLLRNWNEQGDGWVGIGDEAEAERLAALTNLHNTQVNANEGKWVMQQDPDTGRYRKVALPPHMLTVHQDFYDSAAEALLNDDLEQAGQGRELAQTMRVLGLVALDPTNLIGAGFISKAGKIEKLVGESTAIATAERNAAVLPAEAAKAKEAVEAVAAQRARANAAEGAADELRGTATEVMEGIDEEVGSYFGGVLDDLRAQEGDLLGQADTLVNALRRRGLERQADANDLLVDSNEIGLFVSNRLQEVEKELRAAGDLKGAELHANTRRALDETRESFANRMTERAELQAQRLDEEAKAARAATRKQPMKAAEAAIDARYAESRVNAAVKATEHAEETIGFLLRGRGQKPVEEGPVLLDGARVAEPTVSGATDAAGTVSEHAARLVDQATRGEAWTPTSGARDSVLVGDRVVGGQAWEPSPNAAAAVEAQGGVPMSWVELDSFGRAEVFADAINSFKASDKYGASVYAYKPADYKKMRLFLSKDGLTGFAVKPDGDIVSVFNANKGMNAVDSIMPMAIQAGGRKADAFDTVLPELYSRYGFKPVARTKWNSEYAPEGWDPQTFGKFNGGEPDVVYLRFDEKRAGRGYTPGEGPVVADDAAAAAQQVDPVPLTEAQKAEAAADQAEIMQAVARLRRAGSRGNRKQIDESIAHLRDTSNRIRAKWKNANKDRAKVETENIKGDKKSLTAQERAAEAGKKKAASEEAKGQAEIDAADEGNVLGARNQAALDRTLDKADKVTDKINDLEVNGPDSLVEVRKLKRELKSLQAAISKEALDKGKRADAEWKKLEELEEALEKRLEMMATAYQMDDVANAVRNGDIGVLDDLIGSEMGAHRIDGLDRKKLMDYFFGSKSAEPIKKALSLMSDPVAIHEKSGRQIPIELAARIAKQTDPEKVVDEILWAMGSSSGIVGQVRGPGLRLMARSFKQGGVGEFGGKPLATVYGASQARVPWGYKYDLADLETLFDGFSDWQRFVLAPKGGVGKLRKVDEEWMHANQMRLLEAGDDLVKRRHVIVEATLDLPRHLVDSGRLGDLGADAEAAQKIIDGFMERGRAVMLDWSKAKGESHGYMNIDDVHKVMLDGYDPVQLSDGKAQRLSQMQSEVMFPSPKAARDLVVRGTKLERSGFFDVPGRMVAWLDTHINQIWRQSVLAFRVAYTLRNAGEMMFRMWLNGDLHDPGTILAMAMDTRKHGRFNKLFATYGKDVKGDAFHDPKYGDIDDLNGLLQREMYRHHAALDTGDVDMLAYSNSGAKRVPSDGKKFDEAMAHNLLNVWSDPIWREVILVKSGRGSLRVKRWAEPRGITDPQEALFQYFRSGPGKRHVDRLMDERPELFRDQFHLDDPSALRTWLTDSTQEGTWAGQTSKMTLGYNESILDALLGTAVEGGSGKRMVEKTIKDLRDKRAYVDQDVHAWALDKTAAAQNPNAWTRSVNWFFDASAAAEGMAAYSPFTRIRYWNHVEKMFPALAKQDQRAILGVAREVMGKGGWTNKSGRQLRRLEKMVDDPSSGSGILTRDEIHGVAARQAAKESEEMFYDAMRNKQHWSALRLAIPFGGAWANTITSWSKLATRSRGALRAYNLAKVYEVSTQPKWINDGSVDPVTMMSNPKLRSYIFQDPRTGDMSFTVPVVGSLFGILTGNPDLAEITMPIPSLNVATGGGNPLPGPGPVLTIPFKTFRNFATMDKHTADWMDAWLNPFPSGEPQDLADVAFESMGAGWAKRIAAGVMPSIGDSQLASQSGPLTNYLFTQDPDKFGTRVELEDGTVTWTVDEAGADRLAEEVASLSRMLSIYRGVMANVSPGTLIFNWQAKAQDGSHPMQSVMMQHWSELIDDAGGNYDQATEQFFDIYGAEAAVVLSSNWKADLQPTNRTWLWMLDNPKEAAEFSDVAGMYMPGGEWSYAYESWMRSGDDRMRATPQERISFATDKGYFVVKSRVDEKVARGELTVTEAQERMKSYKEEYGIRYGQDVSVNGVSDRIFRIREAQSSTLGLTPAGQAAAKYLEVRDRVFAELKKREHVGITSEGNEDLLETLRTTGDTLAIRVPDFGLMWQKTFARELED